MQTIIEQHYYLVLSLFLSTVLAINVPVGRMRIQFPKFSRPWARCIYVPIVINIVLRRLIGLTFKVIPFVILAVLVGQLVGVRLQNTQKGLGSMALEE